MRLLLLILLTLLRYPPAAAQQAKDSIARELESVEVRSYQAVKSEAGLTLDHISVKREAMLRGQGNTFINTLEKLPGISAIHTGAGISKPVIRGLSLNRIIVTEYGIKQEGQQWGVDHGLEIDQFNVDRVEVVKGPVSVLYGSDGIGGVIHILPPAIPVIDTSSVELALNYKSNNDLLGASLGVVHVHKDHYTVARATYQDYASYRVPATSFTYNGYQLPIYNNRLKNTAGKELNFSLLQGIRGKWGKSSLYISNYRQNAGFFIGAFGIPRAYQLNDDKNYRSVDLPRQRINHFKIISNTQLRLGAARLDADLGYQYNTRKELSRPHAHGNGPAPQGNTAMQLDLQTLSFQLKYTLKPNERFRLITGAATQLQWNQRSGYEFLLPSYTGGQSGLFSFVACDINDRFLVTAGLRLDAGWQNALATAVTLYDTSGTATGEMQRSPDIRRRYFNASGSAGIAWEWSSLVSVKINAGTAYRMPVMAELSANGVHHGTFRHEQGNETLNAERGYLLDAGFFIRSESFQLSFTPFANYFSNYIYLSPSARFSPLPDAGQVYQYRETKAIFMGTEWAAEWAVNAVLRFDANLEYVWNRNQESLLPLPFTPPFSVFSQVSVKPLGQVKKLKGFELQLSGQYFAAQNRVDRNEPATPGYFLMNASVVQPLQIGKGNLTIYLQFRNITNTLYRNNMSRYRILNLPEQGFNTQLMLRMGI